MSSKPDTNPVEITLAENCARVFHGAVKVDDCGKMIAVLECAFQQNGWPHAAWASLMVPSQSGQYHVFWEIAEYAAFNCFSQVIQKSFNEAKWILLQELDKERLIARFIFAAAEFHDQRLKDTGGTQIDFELSKLFEFFFAKDGANALTACAELIRALPTLLRPGAEKGSSRVYADFEAKALKIISSQPFADSLQTIRI